MTLIDGIAASENIDSSGERISIAGMDISSLAVDGVFTWEHEAATGPKGEKITIKMPEQTVGKILKAKKIFQKSDCQNDREKYFWDKCETPFIYIMGELFDDYTDAARDLAGKFQYDQDHLNQNERTVMNFSIEGAYIAKEGIEVTRSVARKCTITVTPANKAARAEMIPNKNSSKEKSEIHSLFKTESIEIELIKSEPRPFTQINLNNNIQKHADILGILPMEKSNRVLPPNHTRTPLSLVASASAPSTTQTDLKTSSIAPSMSASGTPPVTTKAGQSIGQTKSGKNVMSHAKIHEYKGFNSQDHQDAANLHHGSAQKASNPEMGKHHLDKMKLHLQAAGSAEQRENRFARGKNQPFTPMGALNAFRKSMDAGSGMGAPGQLTGGAALAKEDLAGKIDHKKKWLARAEEAYAAWPKRKDYKAFMKKRMPHLAEGEIDAIGKALALKKSIDAEAGLAKLLPMNKSINLDDAKEELKIKSLHDIQKETAWKWASRAAASYEKYNETKDENFKHDAEEYRHEAVEHAALIGDTHPDVLVDIQNALKKYRSSEKSSNKQ